MVSQVSHCPFERQLYDELDDRETFFDWYGGFREALERLDVDRPHDDRPETESADMLPGLAMYPAWEAFGFVLDQFAARDESPVAASDYAFDLAVRAFQAARREPKGGRA